MPLHLYRYYYQDKSGKPLISYIIDQERCAQYVEKHQHKTSFPGGILINLVLVNSART